MRQPFRVFFIITSIGGVLGFAGSAAAKQITGTLFCPANTTCIFRCGATNVGSTSSATVTVNMQPVDASFTPAPPTTCTALPPNSSCSNDDNAVSSGQFYCTATGAHIRLVGEVLNDTTGALIGRSDGR